MKTSQKVLPLMEAFYTIQGEGHHSGKAAYFIRLAGCDVGCIWCDVKESWDVDQYPQVDVDEIVRGAIKCGAKIAVITGGEPLMHDLSYLCYQLNKQGIRLHIETSGTYPISGIWDWVTFSPKKFKNPLPEFYKMADELKVIVFNRSDLAWAEQHKIKVEKHCKLYLQPEWDKSKGMLPFVIDYVKTYPDWEISLQTHKFMDIP